MFKKIIFSLICISLTLNCVADHYEVIKPVTKSKDLERVIQLIKENEEANKSFTEAFEGSNGYGVNSIDNMTIYIVDINNDGEDEYIFIGYRGSAGYLHPAIFSIVNNRAILLNDPIGDYIPWAYWNVLTQKDELFVKAQNKIYICGNPIQGALTREIFLWENNSITEVCNKFWINQQRSLFQQLYNKGLFNDALSLLYNFEKKFRMKIDSKTDLWLRNDIALAAIKTKNYKMALEILEQIQKESKFNQTSKNFKSSVDFNLNRCLEKLEREKINGTKGEYDYSWLLTYTDTQPGSDNRFEKVIHNTVPEIKVEDISQYEIKMRLWVSGEVKVTNNRFASFSGFWPHNAGAQALFWCDTKEKSSACALNSYVNINTENILVTSKSLLFEELPSDFYAELDLWVASLLSNSASFNHKLSIDKYIFYDRHGKATEFER